MISSGTFKAHGVKVGMAASSLKGTEAVVVSLELDEGPDKGSRIDWVGWLSEKTAARTAESLALLGYTGEEDGEIRSPNQILAVLEPEDYTNEAGTTIARMRVRWINDLSGAGGGMKPLAGPELAGAKSRLRAALAAQKGRAATSPKAREEDEPRF
jgi:hypothetical protein